MKLSRLILLLATVAVFGSGCWSTKRFFHELRWSGQQEPASQESKEVTPG